MALDDLHRAWREIAVSRDDWIRATGSEAFGEYMRQARERFLKGEGATLKQLREVYRRAAESVRDDIHRVTPGTFRQRHLLALEKALERRSRELTPQIMRATEAGIRLAVMESTRGPEQMTAELLGGVFDQAGVHRIFADINERAALAMLARTGKDGLKLSARVWRIGERWRNAARRLVEDGVARGLDSRKLARELEHYLKPGVHTALKAETRRRLKVSRDVSMEAMRLAVTEMQHAFHEGTVLANKAAPSYRGVYWRLSSSHPISDICDDYARHNGDGYWPEGKEPAKPHPWCRCLLIPAHEPPDQFVERLRQWMDKPGSQPDIERWYTGTAKRFMPRPLLSFAGGGGGGGSGGTGGGHPVDRLLLELADTGREVTPDEMQRIREHVASVMFSPQAATRPGSRGVGKVFRGRELTSQDRLTAGEAHYVWRLQEWPEETSYTDYLRSIVEVVRDSATGVALTRYKNELQASFLRRSGNLRGPGGNEWLLVDYRPSAGHIVTAYQPKAETRREFERRVIRWLLTPR